MYCYVKSLGKERLLLWHMLPSRETQGRVALHILKVSDLEEIVDREQALQRVNDESVRAFWIGPALAEANVSAATEVECIHLDLPAHFKELGELILPVHTNPLVVWVIDAENGKLNVYPQDWFNQGDIDRGYQWVTRMARDPRTGRIIGDGIRIGKFVLDETNRNIERWLDEKPYPH
jgi:hypothetical protein